MRIKMFLYSALVPVLFLSGTSFAFASVTLTSVTLNGSSGSIHVQPGDNIIVALTATLTDGSKWKGIDWGINNNGTADKCVNTKNAKEGTRNNSTGVFTETFTIKAPAASGVYNSTFLADLANNCGKPISLPLTLTQSRPVGTVVVVVPTIDTHENISTPGSASGAIVTYVSPVVKNQSGAIIGTSTCTPASGSIFPAGTTHVVCTYPGAVNGGFDVTVVASGLPVIMASQHDDSYLCTPNWRECFTTASSSQAIINLGTGAALGTAGLSSVTIERDPNTVTSPWNIAFECFTDATYSTHCANWVSTANSGLDYRVAEVAATTADNKSWTANFSTDSNADGSSPITFVPTNYYQLIINDGGRTAGAYGSQALGLPYYVINGITR